jgi:hypothetical protein
MALLPGCQPVNSLVRGTASIAVSVLLLVSTQASGQEAKPSAVASPPAPIAGPIAGTAGPLTVRIEPVGPFKIDNGKAPAPWTFWVPVVGPIISGLLAALGVLLSLRFAERSSKRTIEAARQTNEASIWQKANETELKELISKLDSFYGPFMQMSQANYLMIEEFRSRQPVGFRTLPKVFDPAWLATLSTGDRKIVAEVCQKAADLETFIAEKAGHVDGQLLPYLARASAHFRILYLAHQGLLGEDPNNFLRYVYPKQLDAVLRLEVDRLRRRCDALRANPGSPSGVMEPLRISVDLALEPWATGGSPGQIP